MHLDGRRQVYHCWSVLLLCYQERRDIRTSPTADANARSCESPTIYIISVYLIVWGTLNQDARPCSRLANQRGEYHAFEANVHSDSQSLLQELLRRCRLLS